MDPQKIDEIVNRVAALIEELNRTRAERDALQAKVGELGSANQEEISRLQAEAAEWCSRCEELRAEKDEIASRLAAKEDELLEAQIAVEERDNRLGDIATRLENALGGASAPAEAPAPAPEAAEAAQPAQEEAQPQPDPQIWDAPAAEGNNGYGEASPETQQFSFQ